jgi:hypothetical protein
MKYHVLVFALFVSLVPCSPAPAVAGSSLLTCEIGFMNGVSVRPSGATVPFMPSHSPASAGLQPGQCSYAERALTVQEPHVLCFQATVTNFAVANGALQSSTVFGGAGAALAQAASFGPTKLLNFMVHGDAGTPCLTIDTFY